MAWSQLAEIRSRPVATTDFLDIRFKMGPYKKGIVARYKKDKVSISVTIISISWIIKMFLTLSIIDNPL